MLSKAMKNAVLAARDMAAERGIAASIQLHHENSHLMRIGNNSVSLNTSEELTRLDIEVIKGNRKGTHTHLGEVEDAEELLKLILSVQEKADKSAEMDYAPVLPVIEENIRLEKQYDAELENLDPAVKAAVYGSIIEACGQDYNYSGSWSSGSTETLLVTTANANRSERLLTDQQFTCVLKDPEKKWELAHWQTGWRAGDVTAEKTIHEFRALLPVYGKNSGAQVEPGRYKVLLGSQAIGELIRMAVWTGCAGRTWEMKMGWTADKKIGDQILHSSVTVHDDPDHENVFADPISDSGMTARRLPMVEHGKLAGLLYDRNTASRYGKEATANAGCLSMAPGTGPEDPLEALAGEEKVLSIPAIHYMNLPNMSKGIFTGSSRFSAVLVKNGKILCPIFSSRITDSFDRVFGNIVAMSSKTVSVNTSNTYGRRSPDAVSVPEWILVEDVKITDCAESF